MGTDFEINSTSPPDDAYPRGAGYQFNLPTPTGFNGQGDAVGASGKPSVVLQFSRLTHEAFNWYANFTGTNPTVDLTALCTWNPYKSGGGGWVDYDEAKMHRPTYKGMDYGGYTGVEVRFSELVEA